MVPLCSVYFCLPTLSTGNNKNVWQHLCWNWFSLHLICHVCRIAGWFLHRFVSAAGHFQPIDITTDDSASKQPMQPRTEKVWPNLRIQRHNWLAAQLYDLKCKHMRLGITMVLVNKHLDITIFLFLILRYLLSYEWVESEFDKMTRTSE
jgi:hypothetical protein